MNSKTSRYYGARDPMEEVSRWAVIIYGELVDTQTSSMPDYLPVVGADFVSQHVG